MMTRAAQSAVIFTVGHSAHEVARFVDLLARHGVEAVADVRSMPYSRRHPQFNRETLRESLKASGIAYVFLGKELGARSTDPACYENGASSFGNSRRPAFFDPESSAYWTEASRCALR